MMASSRIKAKYWCRNYPNDFELRHDWKKSKNIKKARMTYKEMRGNLKN